MTDDNPYAPPAKTLELLSSDPLTAARLELGRPATAIIIMASIHAVFDSIPLVFYAIISLRDARLYSGSGPTFEPFLLFSVHVFQAICGAKMGHLESLRLAYVGAILVTIPVLSPFFVLGIPFGVWALILLRKPSNRKAFELASARFRPPPSPPLI